MLTSVSWGFISRSHSSEAVSESQPHRRLQQPTKMTFELPCVPVLKKFCWCCCTVKQASVVLGWLAMCAYVVICVLNALIIIHFDELHVPRKYHDGVESLYLTMLIICVTITLFNGLLLLGIHSEKPSLMLPYLLFSLFLFVFTLMAILYYGISVLAHDRTNGLITIFVGPLFYVIGAYFWIIIYSHYRQLEEEVNPKRGVQYEKYITNTKHYPDTP
ncbi:uncharacterized protein [Periplaneta americana]|uniref:uncharacterized protein n=1 Tax=Periplaneta americana TaxID=6978 RepID=UPI0037E70407